MANKKIRTRSRQLRLGAVLKRLPDGGPTTAVEVGVLRGEFSRMLLLARPQLTLYMVDLWAHNPSVHYRATGAPGARFFRRKWNRIYREALRNTAQFRGRAIPLHLDSVAAAKHIDNESLDGAFIDDDHSKEGCTRSIQAYWPKVRSGAWIGGHDYGTTGRRKRYRFRVTEAVREFFGPLGLPIEVDVDGTWFVWKL